MNELDHGKYARLQSSGQNLGEHHTARQYGTISVTKRIRNGWWHHHVGCAHHEPEHAHPHKDHRLIVARRQRDNREQGQRSGRQHGLLVTAPIIVDTAPYDSSNQIAERGRYIQLQQKLIVFDLHIDFGEQFPIRIGETQHIHHHQHVYKNNPKRAGMNGFAQREIG